MASVHDVQSLLNRLAEKEEIEATDRISAALKLTASGRGGAVDAAVLLRQVLRADDVRRSASGPGSGVDAESRATSAWLDVPHSQSFPTGLPVDRLRLRLSTAQRGGDANSGPSVEASLA